MVGPRLIGDLGPAKSETALLQTGQISDAPQLFYVDAGRYPIDAKELSVLINSPPGDSNWQRRTVDVHPALD